MQYAHNKNHSIRSKYRATEHQMGVSYARWPEGVCFSNQMFSIKSQKQNYNSSPSQFGQKLNLNIIEINGHRGLNNKL